jgi:phospholipid/cholesterol/gamma-HCH transport system ATP-binding protein
LIECHNLIECRNVSVGFDRPVLRDVSLTVPSGCLYGLIGPGASGKSVLLKSLVGLLPCEGEVKLLGRSLKGLDDGQLMDLRRKVGMLFQNNALFDFMTVADNVAFPLQRLFDLPAEEVQRRVSERLSRVGLPGFEARMPAGLSGGQKKRVGVARATVTEADIVLYDEPAAGLDPVSSQKLFDLLRLEQQTRKTTVVMVSSDLARLLTVTDRVGMLLKGKLVFDGTTEEARQSTDPYVRQFVHGLVEGPL